MSATVPQTSGTPQAPPPDAMELTAPAQTAGAASSSEQKAPPPKDTFAPRKFAPAAPTSSSGSPDLLRLVATQPYYTVQNLATSTFIPSTLNFFLVIGAMDSQMVHTHKYVQSNPHWHPLITQLYTSLLIYIHIIRCMMESDPTNFLLAQFYDTLYRHFGLESLVVPGPLVPLFAAITLSASPHEWIGNICPTVPLVTNASASNGFQLADRLNMLLPSIPFIIDQIWQLRFQAGMYTNAGAHSSTGDEATYAVRHNKIYHIFNRAIDNVADIANLNVLTPNARYPVYVPFSLTTRFVNNTASLNLPASHTWSPTGSTAMMSYMQYFGFEGYAGSTGTNWLQTVGPVMSTYSSFFSGSQSLLSISCTGLGASIPIAIYTADSHVVPDRLNHTAPVAAVPPAGQNPGTPAVDGYLTVNHPSNNKVTLNHCAPALSELAEQYSALALVNCDYSVTAAASTSLLGPANANIRNGHIWTLPVVRSAADVNTQPGIALAVTTYYHSATPIRK